MLLDLVRLKSHYDFVISCLTINWFGGGMNEVDSVRPCKHLRTDPLYQATDLVRKNRVSTISLRVLTSDLYIQGLPL